MKSKRSSSTSFKTRSTAAPPTSLYHHLDALLHTMRCIAQYEDTLCELSHEVKRAGALSPGASKELSEILEKIPAHDYLIDLDSVRNRLASSSSLKRPETKKAVKTKVVGKKLAGTTKTTVKKSLKR